jgi:signal transduction histidine kinase
MGRRRRLLVALAAAAVLPMVVYGSVQTWLRADAERRALDASNLQEAHRLALAVDNELMAEINTLRILSLSHELDVDDLAGFYDLARRAHFENELWRSLIIIDPRNDKILLNTLWPIGLPYPVVDDPVTVQKVIETHTAVIGAPTGPGPVLGTPRIHPAFVPVRVPVMRRGEVHFVLSASMAPDRLRGFLRNAMPPGLGGDSYLVDPEGHIVARNRSPEGFAEWAPDVLRAALPRHEGIYRGTTADGQQQVFAFATAPFSHWSVHLGVPVEERDAPLRQSFWLSVAGAVLSGALALGLIAMVWREINRQHRHEAALQSARRLEAVGQLTAGVAHDFNNLLCTVIGNLELIQARTARMEAPSIVRNIEEALKAAERGVNLTQQLLSFAREQTLHAEPVDMNSTLRGLEALVHQSVGEDIEVQFELCEGGCRAVVDTKEFSLSIVNLVTNARDAMPHGGTLTLSTRYTDLHPGERVDDLRPGRYAVFAVTDTGVGMSQKVMERAFEPFFTTKEIGRGTGLGLSQVYGIARQSGGTVRLRSKEGQGCRVEVWLPATK